MKALKIIPGLFLILLTATAAYAQQQFTHTNRARQPQYLLQ
jgi:hypothetical protein